MSRWITRYVSRWPAPYKPKTKRIDPTAQQKPLPAVLSCGCKRNYYPAAVPGSSVWCLGCDSPATVRSAA